MQWALVIFAMVIFGVAVAAVIWLAQVLKAQGDLRMEVRERERERDRVQTLLLLEQDKSAGLERALRGYRDAYDQLEAELAGGVGVSGDTLLRLLRDRLSKKGL